MPLPELMIINLEHQSNACYVNKMFNLMTFNILPYSRKYWWSLNLAVWAPNDVFHTIQDLNLAVWYGIAIRTCMRKKNLADFNLAV